MTEFFRKLWRVLFNFRLPEIPAYGLLYFDQLQSEKTALKAVTPPSIVQADNDVLEVIDGKRVAYSEQTGNESQYITWQDIYTYELILLKYRDFDDLKSKILSLRTKYRNAAGQKEYDIYLASKPPDLAAITNPQAQMDLLRGDCEYLLREFFSLYSYMTAREQLRSKILVWATILTLIFLCIASIFVTLNLTNSDRAIGQQNANSPATAESAAAQTTSTGLADSNVNSANATDDANINASLGTRAATPRDVDSAATPAVGEEERKDRGISIISVAIFAGVMGAFVSMHLRIQSLPSEGDPIYTFSMLMHGWFSIFLSPVSGAVFAVVLYLFFSGQLLTGTIFPKIVTPGAPAARATPTTAPTLSPTQPMPTLSPAPRTVNTPAGGAAAPSATLTQAPTLSPSPSPSPSSTPQDERKPATTQTPLPSGQPVGLYKFLEGTGPATGVDFALLVIWSFIAGFAERFVPDTLSRLTSRNEVTDGRRI